MAIEPRYTIALSFAREERGFAEKVARSLRTLGIAVFYDRFEQHELWGRDLFAQLREIYTAECHLCLMLISETYLSRMWTAFERQQIIERMARDHGKVTVLPVRMDGFEGEVPGLSRAIGYIEASTDKPGVLVQGIVKCLHTLGLYSRRTSNSVQATLHEVKAAAVGVFFDSPGWSVIRDWEYRVIDYHRDPDVAPYVREGDEVEPGTILCQLCVLGDPEDIESEFKGRIRRIRAVPGELVDYDGTIMEIEAWE